ncbi:hypothetical protein [Pseudonocardia aurantiaca]|uniref:DUF222 domain-containing protein n=1 Tax=Pseudonocardia aurantiaca TaxID=75290 RepID=A0ABW4FY58_9PSEU
MEHARELSPAQIARLCAELLPAASGWTTGQLGDRLRKWCLSLLDPDVLRRRYQTAVRERAVSGYLNRDGTATISASGLSPAEAAASCERVFELARAIRRAGHPDRLSRIRADLFLALLDGSLQQLTNDEVIAAMLARREAQDTGLSESTSPCRAGSPGIARCGVPTALAASPSHPRYRSRSSASRIPRISTPVPTSASPTATTRPTSTHSHTRSTGRHPNRRPTPTTNRRSDPSR